MTEKQLQKLLVAVESIADSLTKLVPSSEVLCDFTTASAFVWKEDEYQKQHILQPIKNLQALPLHLLHGIDSALSAIYENTKNFGAGFVANNVLLWGARGMGKSSAVKSVFTDSLEQGADKLRLIEIDRDDVQSLPLLLKLLEANSSYRFVVFCDDLSFDIADSRYKALKSALEGGIRGRPDNCVFYATSNQRHLTLGDAVKAIEHNAIKQGEAIDENVSLSDRFGLWVGFHKCTQPVFLRMVETYQKHFEIPISKEKLHKQALQWSIARGARSGRVAWQFTISLLGKYGLLGKHGIKTK